MASDGVVTKFGLTNAGDKGVVISGAAWDELITRINMLSAPTVVPSVQVGAFKLFESGYLLDLSLLDQRMSNVEARLNAANAVANCVGNTVTFTFTI